MANLLARKSLDSVLMEAQEAGEHALRRALGPVNLLSLGIGAIIGAGIFVLTGAAAAQYAGPAISLSFVLAGFACVFAGLCYAEFASLIPVAGSAYTYGYATLGELLAWVIGWDLILEYALSAATVASGWSANVVSLLQDFGIHLRPALTDTPGTRILFYNGRWEPITVLAPVLQAAGVKPDTLPQIDAVFNLVAFAVIWAVTAILVIGVRESANFNTAIVALKVFTVLVFIGVAARYLLKNTSVA